METVPLDLAATSAGSVAERLRDMAVPVGGSQLLAVATAIPLATDEVYRARALLLRAETRLLTALRAEEDTL